MSPWAKLDVASEVCKGKYVMSCKPSPAIFASSSWDPDEAKKQIIDICKSMRSCNIEIIMKDISTVRYQPKKLWDWARIAKETIDEIFD